MLLCYINRWLPFLVKWFHPFLFVVQEIKRLPPSFVFMNRKCLLYQSSTRRLQTPAIMPNKANRADAFASVPFPVNHFGSAHWHRWATSMSYLLVLPSLHRTLNIG